MVRIAVLADCSLFLAIRLTPLLTATKLLHDRLLSGLWLHHLSLNAGKRLQALRYNTHLLRVLKNLHQSVNVGDYLLDSCEFRIHGRATIPN